ncbi:DUF1800 family protein [Microvirga sp. BT689]|uniref:DUF1800 domain-containing protein n=1 Tax=Microvirga arvi TaxID=2778731 RepID=UPI001950C751|nr:DUF1800 family protein [Microvirga arvi]MBM6583331.1 DUF1800 family protein [Microvirga arvi]
MYAAAEIPVRLHDIAGSLPWSCGSLTIRIIEYHSRIVRIIFLVNLGYKLPSEAGFDRVSLSNTLHPALALIRFGLGAKAGELATIGTDSRDYLLDEVKRGATPQPNIMGRRDTSTILNEVREEATRVQLARATPPSNDNTHQRDGLMLSRALDKADAEGKPLPVRSPPQAVLSQQHYETEVAARIDVAIRTDAGFTERLVWFWSNHFALLASKRSEVRATAGAFEREAIRPHVFGSFYDMLLAAETHPAMLYSLDNDQSVGPNSGAGQRRRRGLNENLAREILELHTLGSSGRYTQADVTSLAGILTGWTIAGPAGRLGRPGSTVFDAGLHEPGELQVLGKYYPDYGPDQAKDVLLDLARHPATARHIAAKLACHFVADDPPPSLIARLEATFLESGGDLTELSLALLHAPEAWSSEAKKIRTPQEFVFSAMRLTGIRPATRDIINVLNALGQKLWDPPGPDGYPDAASHWTSPTGIKARLEVAARLAQSAGQLEPMSLLDASLGTSVSQETRATIARAESRTQAIALLLMCPEFQRR